jgi:hypothetical protein
MSAGNLEGSWYYYLLGNQQIVKRTKATTISMSDEVIAHLNQQAPNRKIRKNGNSKQPMFERHINLIVEWTRISPSGYATQVYKVLQAAL